MVIHEARNMDGQQQPMTTVGPGVKEIRVKDIWGSFRTIYLATRPEAIYVLHCFQKKRSRLCSATLSLHGSV